MNSVIQCPGQYKIRTQGNNRSSQLRFSKYDVSILRQTASQYMKMRLCYEIDKDATVFGLAFYDWNPLISVKKLAAKVSESDGICFLFLSDLDVFSWKDALEQEESPLSVYEVIGLGEMMDAAVHGALSEWLMEGRSLPEISIFKHSAAIWQCNENAQDLARRMYCAIGEFSGGAKC